MNIVGYLQELDNLIIEHTTPPVTPILRNQLALALEQAEAHADAVAKQDQTLSRQIDEIERLMKENAKVVQANQAVIEKQNEADAELENKRLQEAVDETGRQVLECLFGEPMTAEEIAEAIGCPKGQSDYYIDCLGKIGFIERHRFTGDRRRIDGSDWGWAITQNGRTWIIKRTS